MNDEPIIETRGKGDAKRNVLSVSLWTALAAAMALGTAAFTHVRSSDLDRLHAVDLAGQKRGETNGNRIDAVEMRLSEAERDARAGRDRIIRLEVATENQAKSLDKIETGVERLNVKVDEIRRKAAP